MVNRSFNLWMNAESDDTVVTGGVTDGTTTGGVTTGGAITGAGGATTGGTGTTLVVASPN